MSKSVKCIVSILLILLTVCAPIGVLPSAVTAYAATTADLNSDSVFLKQNTAVTCTLSSAAMLMRRTAICADYAFWEEITEENIRETAWVDGLGLLWNYTSYNITVGHGYFADKDNKAEMLSLLEQHPQGIVIYNGGRAGQSHAVLLCDYDKETDTFYVADPASNATEGRIPFIESTIKGETQDEQIKNLTAYWYIVSPTVTVNNGDYSSSGGEISKPDSDSTVFDSTKEKVDSYYVVTDETPGGVALRYYPSGSSTSYKNVEKGTVLYISYVGKNNFGATWYKTDAGYYIFSSNVTRFDDYSPEIVKFRNTAETANATYSVNSDSDSGVPMRLEPAEGNNIVAYVNNGKKLYITEAGVNSVGAKWLKTSEGYYVKASQMKFESESKLEGAKYDGEYIKVSGNYSSEPIEDLPEETPIEPVKYKITASALNVRKNAVDGEVIGVIAKGTVVEVTAVLSGWGKISYNGRDGWISLEYAETFTQELIPLKIESIILNKNLVQSGNSIKCTVNITSKEECMYRFTVYSEDNKVYSDSYSSLNNVYEFTPEDAGVYYLHVKVISNDGRTDNGYSGNFTVYDELRLGSVRSNASGYTYVNDTITWTVDAITDSDSSIYKYSLYLDGKLQFERESLSDTFTYKPSKAGSYVLKVYLEDDFSSSDEVTAEAVNVYDSLKIDSVKLSSSAVVTGEEIVCKVEASGGIGKYMYCFSVFKNDKLIKNGAYSTLSESTIAFSQEGTYKIFCSIKDSEGTIVSAFSDEITVSAMKLGDVDGNGKIAAADARLTLRHSAKIENLTNGGIIAADVNRDGTVNAADARNILRCAANLESI